MRLAYAISMALFVFCGIYYNELLSRFRRRGHWLPFDDSSFFSRFPSAWANNSVLTRAVTYFTWFLLLCHIYLLVSFSLPGRLLFKRVFLPRNL